MEKIIELLKTARTAEGDGAFFSVKLTYTPDGTFGDGMYWALDMEYADSFSEDCSWEARTLDELEVMIVKYPEGNELPVD